MSILDTIVRHKKKEVEILRELISVERLVDFPLFNREIFAMKDFLMNPEKTGIIAEFKKKSPSKGIINERVDVVDVTRGYTNYGASALSVLTDFNFFGGTVDDLQKAREANDIPILRKEFIIDEYQLYEAKATGADAILLIAAILDRKEARTLARKSKELGLQVLMELHEEKEIGILNEFVDLVGVNNRNLKTFEVSLQHSAGLAGKIPGDFFLISESGISTVEDIIFLKGYGFRGFLMGENFMKTSDPVKAFMNFAKELFNLNV
jgi:indole-3-glycerol phosphate synthase